MKIEWDHNKDLKNRRKHKISFSTAAEVFEDPLHISILDKRFSYFEERWITIGATENFILIVVAHNVFSEDGEEIIRIISAREATNYERRQYEQI
ncbi:MAG TPA: hypothetical protein ENN41_09310 [Sediminispirochaeta sp.]|nr:hypothetical protein [Sediminispirochaeta sp.]